MADDEAADAEGGPADGGDFVVCGAEDVADVREGVGEVGVDTFATGKKSDTILIDKPVDKCCESRKMFADITDDPFLRGQRK